MNHHRISSARSTRRQRRQSPLERIDELLDRDDEGWYAERTQRLWNVLFGESDASNEPGQVKLSE